MNIIDKQNGPIIEIVSTQSAVIFIHEDGYKEALWKDEVLTA